MRPYFFNTDIGSHHPEHRGRQRLTGQHGLGVYIRVGPALLRVGHCILLRAGVMHCEY